MKSHVGGVSKVAEHSSSEHTCTCKFTFKTNVYTKRVQVAPENVTFRTVMKSASFRRLRRRLSLTYICLVTSQPWALRLAIAIRRIDQYVLSVLLLGIT